MAERAAISFPPFLIPPDVDVLYRDGKVVPLQPHAVRVLRYLAENHDRVVSKNELLDGIWPDTFTTDGVLKKAVLQVRRALGDTAESARFVETHHARGYRFIADVVCEPSPAGEPGSERQSPASNLPYRTTTFVGRERAIERICRALATTRLLTLTGPGGIGKTRLAIEAARRMLEQGTDEVWLAELASLADGSSVPHAVAVAVGAREEASRPILDTLRDHLKARSVLLVLDNCEHLVEACAALADALLQACPALRVLATSRELLDVPGETLFDVPPLSLPDRDEATSNEDLERSEAVQLFLDRATSSTVDASPSQLDLSAVARLCRRLDGIPLAVELAAARTRMLSIEQIVERLDDRFRLLTEGGRTAPARHRTLRAAIDWSYELLPDAERQLFARLSIFSGGWTLDAAEDVCGESGVLDLLGHLASKSFVSVERGDDPRYRMLETLREYAAERLDPAERAALARRHADVFVRLVEKAQTKANGPEEVPWFDRLEREHDNVRAAFDWSMSTDGDVDVGIRIALASQPFLYRRYRLTEGRIWFEQILARPEQAPKAARARVLNVMGIFAFRQGEWERATAHFEEALSLEREMDDPPAVGALTYLGMIAAEAGEYERARAFHEENLIRQRRIGDSQAIAITLNELGVIAQALGDYDQAAAYLAEAAALSRSRGDQLHVAICLIIQAGLEIERGNLDKATELLDEALGLAREGKNQTAVALVAIYSGWVKRQRGEFEGAAASYQEALEFLRSRDDRPGIAGVLEGLAIVAAASSQPARALRLAGAAGALRATTHTRPSPAMQRELDGWTSVAHNEVGEEGALEYAAGQAMALDQAILFALTRAAVSERTRER